MYDELGRLIAVIDPSGDTATYTYDAVGNILAIGRHATSTVSIISFTPTSGSVGSTVTVFGTGFSATASNDTVAFNGTSATITSATTTTLVATVPTGATTGTIHVTAPGGSATSTASFTVITGSLAPTITSFTPSVGVVGDSVTISGTNFDTTAANDRVTLNIMGAGVSSATSTSIPTTVPVNGTFGHIGVETRYGKATSSADFFVPPPTFTVSNVLVTGRITMGGSATTVTIGTASKIGLYVFDGTKDQLSLLSITSNTFFSTTITLYAPNGTIINTIISTASAFSLSTWLPTTGTYTVLVQPTPSYTGSLSLGISALATATTPPDRPSGSYVNRSSALATSLAGLFVMNAGTGTTVENLQDGQLASLAGTTSPSWNTFDPSLVFAGGGSVASYVNAGSDLVFDQLPNNQMTVVAKVKVTTLAAGGIAEKNTGVSTMTSGFEFGWDSSGALMLLVGKSTTNMKVKSNTGAIVPGDWIQVAFTWDGTVGTAASAHLYIYGVEQTKATSTDGSGTVAWSDATSQPFRIGNASWDTIGGAFNGRMAYLAVYKGRILTTTEMATLDAALPIAHADKTLTIATDGTALTALPSTAGQKMRLRFSANQAQLAAVSLTSNTLGSTSITLEAIDGTVIATTSSSASSFTLARQWLPTTTNYMVYVEPPTGATGSITVALTVTDLPPRATSSTLDTGSALATSLVGLFLMNEGTGTTDANLYNSHTAAFTPSSGTNEPTWDAAPAVVFKGGSALNSYLNAGTDSAFDQMPTSKITIVGEIYVSTLAIGGIAEKNDGNTIDSGFIFGWDGSGLLRFTLERAITNLTAGAASTITAGKWLQVAVTWDGTVTAAASNVHFFVNGYEVTKTTTTDGSGTVGYTHSTNSNFGIGTGSNFSGLGGSLNGKFAYLAVYKGRILTLTELRQLAAQLPIH